MSGQAENTFELLNRSLGMIRQNLSGLFAGRRRLLCASALVGLLIALLIPATAMAIPGSGEFVALYSETGREITALYNLIAKICLVILIIVEGVLLFAIIRFRRRDDDERPLQNHGNLKLEFGWTMAALAIQVWIGVLTIDVMWSTETVPEDGIDMVVVAEASQWDWDFHYEFPDHPDRDSLTHPDLVVPAHTNIKLQVTSRDVLHAIFIPELGVKIDAVPGRFNHWWFRADGPIAQVRPENSATIARRDEPYPQTRRSRLDSGAQTARAVSGLERRVDFLGVTRQVEEVSPYAGYNAIEYQGLCAELCGRDHWDMYFRAVVMTPSSFERWVDDQLSSVDEVDGASVYARRCATCHGDDGTGGGGNPTLVGADRVVNPDRKDDQIEIILVGEGAMQAFGGTLNDAEVAAVVNHERTSWGNDGGTVDEDDVARVRNTLGLPARPATAVEPTPTDDLLTTGERIYRSCASCHGADGRGPNFIPDLAGSELVLAEEVDDLVTVLTEGRDLDQWPGRKTPVARSMTDMQLASLLTYIRQSFGNEASEVQPLTISELRKGSN